MKAVKHILHSNYFSMHIHHQMLCKMSYIFRAMINSEGADGYNSFVNSCMWYVKSLKKVLSYISKCYHICITPWKRKRKGIAMTFC